MNQSASPRFAAPVWEGSLSGAEPRVYFFVRRGVMASPMPAVGHKETPMKEVEQLVAELKQLRDELALRVHLASMEIHQDWNKLERDWSQFKTRAALDETAEGVSEALGQVGQELRAGYRRIRKALEED